MQAFCSTPPTAWPGAQLPMRRPSAPCPCSTAAHALCIRRTFYGCAGKERSNVSHHSRAYKQACRSAQDASAMSISASSSNSSSSSKAPQAFDSDRSPTLFERTCAAAMFLLPLSEGLYRLALVAVSMCRRNALDLLIWSKVQHGTILSTLAERGMSHSQHMTDELQACQTVMDWSQQIYIHLDATARQLLSFSTASALNLNVPALGLPAPLPYQLPQFLAGRADVGAWVSGTFGTPAALWSLVCLAAMVIVMAVADERLLEQCSGTLGSSNSNNSSVRSSSSSSADDEQYTGIHQQQQQQHQQQHQHQQRRSAQVALFRRPELPLLSCCCALLLRVSWVPMAGISGMAGGVYRPAAVLLTGATTFISLAALGKVAFQDMRQQPKEALGELVAGVKGVVVWHRTLLLLDWLLSLFGALPVVAKVQLTGAFAAYGVAVEYLTSRAEEVHALVR